MQLHTYKIKATRSLNAFEFTSVGPKGKIFKLVYFTETSINGIYNLGFGDRIGRSGEVGDTVISDNGDSKKVLATVAACVIAFTEENPNSWVFATGSTKSRTRLYQIGITLNLPEILDIFEVYALYNNSWEEFRKGVQYEAFLIRRK